MDTTTIGGGNAAEVRHNVAASRFELAVDGHLSIAEYMMDGATVIFTHTFVPPELRGRGVAEKLVRTALEWAQMEKRKVVPACSYVGKYLERHPEFRSLVG
jgi:predicted GNAT family acetyltransferase